MKIRKIVNGEVQWFGLRNNGVYESPMLDIKNEGDYIEAYKYRIFNLLSIVRGELPDATYGIKGVFGRQNKDETDVEIMQALRTKLNLTINIYESKVIDRQYHCKFTVTTPKGISISLESVI